jgi:hypothetical protein
MYGYTGQQATRMILNGCFVTKIYSLTDCQACGALGSAPDDEA